jgi:hypothetical protein
MNLNINWSEVATGIQGILVGEIVSRFNAYNQQAPTQSSPRVTLVGK